MTNALIRFHRSIEKCVVILEPSEKKQLNGLEESQVAGDEIPYAEELAAEQVRWFYKDGVDKRWMDFCGYDSLRIEEAWRKRRKSPLEESNDLGDAISDRNSPVVKGGMYYADVDKMKCVSIYCPGSLRKFKLEVSGVVSTSDLVFRNLNEESSLADFIWINI